MDVPGNRYVVQKHEGGFAVWDRDRSKWLLKDFKRRDLALGACRGAQAYENRRRRLEALDVQEYLFA